MAPPRNSDCPSFLIAIRPPHKRTLRARRNRQFSELARLEILVLDEFGYVPASKFGAELLFDVISTAYERTSVIVTTSLLFEQSEGRETATARERISAGQGLRVADEEGTGSGPRHRPQGVLIWVVRAEPFHLVGKKLISQLLDRHIIARYPPLGLPAGMKVSGLFLVALQRL